MYILWDPEREAVCSDIDVVVVGKQVIFVLDSYWKGYWLVIVLVVIICFQNMPSDLAGNNFVHVHVRMRHDFNEIKKGWCQYPLIVRVNAQTVPITAQHLYSSSCLPRMIESGLNVRNNGSMVDIQLHRVRLLLHQRTMNSLAMPFHVSCFL